MINSNKKLCLYGRYTKNNRNTNTTGDEIIEQRRHLNSTKVLLVHTKGIKSRWVHRKKDVELSGNKSLVEVRKTYRLNILQLLKYFICFQFLQATLY